MASNKKPEPYLLTKAQAARGLASGSYRAYPRTAPAPTYSGAMLPAAVNVAVKSATAVLPKDRHGSPTYHSDAVRHRVVRTTSYSCAENEVGAYGSLNAVGTTLKYGMVRSAAADWSRYPVGTTFKIKGLPYTYVIDDFGSSLVGTNTIDIYHPNLGLMRQWATRDVEISIIRWGSLERTANLLRGRTKHAHCAQMYYATLRKLESAQVASASAGASGGAL